MGYLRSKAGEVLLDKDELLNRWSEYIEKLFYDERGEKPLMRKNIEGPEIMKAEVKHALNKTRVKNLKIKRYVRTRRSIAVKSRLEFRNGKSKCM